MTEELGLGESKDELRKVLESKKTETPLIRVLAPWEIPLNGRTCIVTYRDGEQSEAIFRAFGSEYEELNNGVGQYPVAIVELKDGSLQSVYVEQVRFVDREVKG